MSYQNQPASGGGARSYQSMPTEHTSIYMGDASRSMFNTKQIRSAFVTKVYSILLFQLVVATFIVAWFSLHEPTKNYFKGSGYWWLYVASAVGIVVYLVLICIESTRRSFPTNFILLLVLTLAYGLVAGIFAAHFQTITVLCAFGATAFATLVIILLAKFAPFDITTCGCALFVLALVHIFGSLILILVLVPMGYGSTASLLIAGVGAFLVSLYLLFDLQLIMGGRTMELSPEEYILAAAMLYIDIINLFQYMLILFGGRD